MTMRAGAATVAGSYLWALAGMVVVALLMIPLVSGRLFPIPIAMGVAALFLGKTWVVAGIVAATAIFSLTYAATAPNPCVVVVEETFQVAPGSGDVDCRSRLLLADLDRGPIAEDRYMAASIAGIVTVLALAAVGIGAYGLRHLRREQVAV
jgi:hypothetical protein